MWKSTYNSFIVTNPLMKKFIRNVLQPREGKNC